MFTQNKRQNNVHTEQKPNYVQKKNTKGGFFEKEEK